MLLEMEYMGSWVPDKIETATSLLKLNLIMFNILLQGKIIHCLLYKDKYMPVEIIPMDNLEPFSIKNSHLNPSSNQYLIQSVF